MLRRARPARTPRDEQQERDEERGQNPHENGQPHFEDEYGGFRTYHVLTRKRDDIGDGSATAFHAKR
jgi:hypothetical protein